MTIELKELTRIDIKPGEVLAVHLRDELPNEQLRQIRAEWKSLSDIPALFFTPFVTKLEAINPNAE
jgi:hypothetical protein